MELTGAIAFIMVTNNKSVFLLFIFFAFEAWAGFGLGLSRYSWQEKVPVIYQSTRTETMTTFNSTALGINYDYLFSKRWIYAIALDFASGKADLQKMDQAITPRKNFTSYLLTNKLSWRVTKKFNFGSSVVWNNYKIDSLSETSSTGLYLNFDYNVFDNVFFNQSLGTMSDSQQLAYTLSFIRSF